MLALAAAVLFAIAQAQNAQAAAEKASLARRKAAAALEAKARADDAAEEARVELNRLRVQTAEQLAAYQTTTGPARSGAHTECEEVRAVAAKAVTDAQKAAEVAIQKAIADRDRILAERAADMHQQIEQAKADAQAQVKVLQDQAKAAKAEAAQTVKTLRDELAHATSAVSGVETEKAKAERAAELDQAAVAQQRARARLSGTRAPGLAERRKQKMTPELVDKAQRMYDSRRFRMVEIAQSCAVSPTTIYRHIRTGQTTTH